MFLLCVVCMPTHTPPTSVWMCSYLGQDEAVVVGVPGVFRSVLHCMKEQH